VDPLDLGEPELVHALRVEMSVVVNWRSRKA
jgi:hypothetical protein